MKTTRFLFFMAVIPAAAFLLFSCSDDSDDPGEKPIDPEYKGTFAFPSSEIPVRLQWGEVSQVRIDIADIASVETIGKPEGWEIMVNTSAGTASIVAPSATDSSADAEGTFRLVATDNWNNRITSELEVYCLDYSHPSGTFLILEGVFNGANGTIAYLDQHQVLHRNVYEQANESEMGNIVQDIYIANGNIYILAQNGNESGGDGSLVIANARTMKRIEGLELDFNSVEGVTCWPQHIVVTGPDKAFIQYATSDWELNSGIRVLDLNSYTISPTDIEGTYGTFNSEGASKGRMVFSRGKIYAACGHKIAVIDPVSERVVQSHDFERVVKGIVKGADGNLYMPVAGYYEAGASPYEEVTFTSAAVIAAMDHNGDILSEKELPAGMELSVSPGTPKIGLCADFSDNYIYFTTGQDFAQTAVCRFNYVTGVASPDYKVVDHGVYGYMGVHPSSSAFFIPETINYMDASFTVIYKDDPEKIGTIYDFNGNSPAGVDFGYRFTEEFIHK